MLQNFNEAPFSNLSWLNENYSDIEDDLDDLRNCTMVSKHKQKLAIRISNLLSQIANPSDFARYKDLNRIVWLTPSFLSHFDITGVHCYETLQSILHFQSIQLGFQLQEGLSGNLEQQKNKKQTFQVAYWVCKNTMENLLVDKVK